MGSATMIIFTILIAVAQLMDAARLSAKQMANETFFNSTFNACKGSRPQNPVEAVRYHVFATKILNAVGVKRMIQISTKHDVPAFALYPLTTLFCDWVVAGYTYYDKTGNMILPASVPQDEVLALARRVIDVGEITSPRGLMVLHRGKKFRTPWNAIRDFDNLILSAVFKVDNGRLPRDANMFLHLIEHFRYIFL